MSDHLTVYFQINTMKYDADREITNIYENLQIVWSQFVTDMLLFVSIRSTLNIYSFIGIRIRSQRIQTNSYSVTFDIRTIQSGIQWTNPKVKKQLFAVTYLWPTLGAYQNRSLYENPLYGYAPALSGNMRLGWNWLLVTNAPAYSVALLSVSSVL